MYSVAEIMLMIARNDMSAFYNDRYWRRLSKEVIKEQHRECYRCRKRGRYTPAKVVHHVKHLRQFPKLAYQRYYTDDNGKRCIQLMALCQQCHEIEHDRAFSPTQTPHFKNPERW